MAISNSTPVFVTFLALASLLQQFVLPAQSRAIDPDLAEYAMRNLYRNRNAYQMLSKFGKKPEINNEIEDEEKNRKIASSLFNDMLQNSPKSLADLADEKQAFLEYLKESAREELPAETTEYDNGESDYYQNLDEGFYPNGPDSWFDGPILPRVNPVESDDTEGNLNKLLVNYLYSQYYNTLGEENENAGNQDAFELEKRRQKIVIKDEQPKVEAPVTPKPTTKPNEEDKLRTKNVKHVSTRGQKEVAMLRPAEYKTKEEWPSKLEESNLAEEEQKIQTRAVRDVLTAELDNLKKESKTEQHKI